MILALALAAHAQDCSPSETRDLERWDARARDALYAEDLVRFDAVWTDLQRALPCVDTVIEPEPWARFLMALAVYEYARGLKWAQPLATAVQTWPEVPRDLGPPQVREHPTPPPPEGLGPLPEDAEVWLDGHPIREVPVLQGPHVLQRRVGERIETLVIRDGGFPDTWLAPAGPPAPPVSDPAQPAVWAVAAVGGGVGGRSQVVSADNTHVPEERQAGAVLGISSLGAGETGQLVLGWTAHATLQLEAGPSADVYALGGLPLGRATLLGGAGATTGVVRVDEGARVVVLPQPHLEARIGAGPVVVGAGGGWTLAAWHAGVTGSAQLRESAGPALVASLLAHHSAFDERGGDLRVDHLRWTATLAFGGSFGR